MNPKSKSSPCLFSQTPFSFRSEASRGHRILRNLLLFCSLLFSAVSPSHAEIIGIENFDYPDGALAGQTGGTFWDWNNDTHTHTDTRSDWDNVIGSAQIVNGKLQTSGGQTVKREFNGITEGSGEGSDERLGAYRGGGTVYFRVDLTRESDGSFSTLSSYDFGAPRVYFEVFTGDSAVGVSSGGQTTSGKGLIAGQTHTLVGKLDFDGDKIELWVDPDLSGTEPEEDATRTYTGTNWSTAVALGSGGEGITTWDNLVVTDSWADLGKFITVTTTADEDNGNASPTAGAGISLREALKYAPSGTHITFAPGIAGGTITLSNDQLTVPAGKEIYINAGVAGMTIDANASQSSRRRVMTVGSGATAALHGLTLTGGWTADGSPSGGSGGGILADSGSTVTLTACTVSDNRTGDGTGDFDWGGDGGGIFANSGSTLTLTACTVSDNRTGDGTGADFGGGGGGISHFGSSLTISHSTIARNAADSGRGGGIVYYEPGVVLTASIVAENVGSSGNDIFQFFFGTVTIGTDSYVGDLSDWQFTTQPTTGGSINLAPLGDYGGPTQTMHPLAGSPAILTGANTTRTDQRGFTLTGPPTIGAVKLGQVAPVSDEFQLRTAISTAGFAPGKVIRFSPTLNGGTITLMGGQLEVPGTANGLFIDASSLANGLTIDANQQSRVMKINSGATAALHGLTLTQGMALGSFPESFGGGILNDNATLSLSACTLSDNFASGHGGGIYSKGFGSGGSATLSLSGCTVSGNSAAGSGGGIYSSGGEGGSATLSLSGCTLSGNSAIEGGGIKSSGDEGSATLSLSDCTFYGNSANSGGGIFSTGGIISGGATLSLSDTILAGNTAGTGPDLRVSGTRATTNATGNNLLSSLSGQTSLSAGPTVTVDAPNLAPLGHYGGPTQTMPPLPGSPAINAASTSTRTHDQRGFSTVGTADIGAAESRGSGTTITWNPAAITYPTNLSNSLNATANPGSTLTYDRTASEVLNAGDHQLTVFASPNNPETHNPAVKTVTLTVQKLQPTITWPFDSRITYGTSLVNNLNATSNLPGTFEYTIDGMTGFSPASVLDAGENYSVTLLFTPTDAANHTGGSENNLLEVTQASLTITADDKERAAGAANPPFTATYAGFVGSDTVNDLDTLPVIDSIATPNAPPGRIAITVTGGSDNNYKFSRREGILTVLPKVVPTITWNNPAAITFGTALSSTQLNASASAAGTFSYDPAVGTTLNAGTHTLTATFTPDDSAAFTGATKTVTLTVNKATPILTWNTPAPITYGTNLGITQFNAIANVPGTDFEYTILSGISPDVGTHPVSVIFTPDDTGNYTNATASVTLTVTPAALTISADDKQRGAGAANPTLTASYSGLTNGDTAPATLPSLSTTAVIDSEPGTYPITVSGGSDPNYTITRVNGTLTVASKQVPVITWNNPAAITFGTTLGAAQLNASSSVAGTFSYLPTTGATLDAGQHTLSATFTPTNSAAFASATKTVTLTVNKATPVITWSNPATITYGTALGGTQLNASSTAPGTITYSPASGVLNAGTHPLNANLAESDNFVAASKQVNLTVTPAALTITADNKQRGAGVANPTLTASYSGLVNGDTAPATPPSLSTTAGIDSDPGSYPITVSGGADPNYSISRVNGTLTIASKRVPVLTWNNPAAITFGTTLGATQLNATADVPGTFSYSPTTGATLDAGTQTLTVNFTPTDSAAIATASKTVTLTINKATPTITWSNPAAITYGTALGSSQLNASTTAPGTLAFSPTTGTALGAGNTQQLQVTFTPSDGNFESATKTVSIDVNKAPLTITAEDKQRGAGIANPSLTASFSGFVNGDTALATPPSLTTTATTSSAAGSYPITISGGDDPNYAITRINGTLTVSAKELPVVTWSNPAAITYGTALGSSQLNAAADVDGTFSYVPASGTVLDAGNSQTLTATFTPANSAAFASTTKTVTINVDKATPTITWNAPAAITYGTPLSSSQLNATSTEAGTLSYSPAIGTVLGAGNGQQLMVTFPASANFNTASKTVSIDVNKAPLTITAEGKQRGAGIANPTLTASYSGFVNGDTASDLTTPVSLSTTATITSAAGSYPITASGATSPDYAITFVPGTLTVSSKEVPVIAWSNPAAITYGTALTATQLNASSATPGSFTYSPPLGTVLAAGNGQTLTVNFTPTDSAAFANASQNVQITINPKALTIRANNASRKEGSSNPTFTASYTGLTNGDSAPSSAPTLSTTATSDSAPGTYPITINGGSDPNYTITRVNGTLTVTEGDPVEPTEAPELFITRIGSQLAITWQQTEGWALHESETLIDWEPVDERAIEQEGEMLIFSTPAASGAKIYFRLEKR